MDCTPLVLTSWSSSGDRSFLHLLSICGWEGRKISSLRFCRLAFEKIYNYAYATVKVFQVKLASVKPDKFVSNMHIHVQYVTIL